MKSFIIAGLLVVTAAGAIPLPMPPAIKPAVHYKAAVVPKQASQLATHAAVIAQPPGTVLSWTGITNSCYIVMGSTNLVSWYFRTNQPLGSASVFVPQLPGAAMEVYRIYTALQATDGSFYVQYMGSLTNGTPPTP
jgi:hypothetical protein